MNQASNRITLFPIPASLPRGRYPIRPRDAVPTTAGLPWTTYTGIVTLQLAGTVVIARRPDHTLVSISTLKGKRSANDIPFQVHPNLVHIYESYIMYDTTQVINVPAIHTYSLAQVLKGIRFLHERQLLHGSIKLGNILVSAKAGDVEIKIANLAMCAKLPQGHEDSLQDIRSLGTTMRHLMEKGLVLCPDSAPLQNPGQWSAEAINFNNTTAFASPSVLAGHAFLKVAAPTMSLSAPILISTLAAKRNWKPYIGANPQDGQQGPM
ncbi:unnamed protein product [Tuber aestivum]|uniref:Protein kinase domain-containing protein n=1 Tax=Tuber aestivum TaxID=59557 RepID=A0A292PK80_9PEZI|nr:unnamed protein product [Tuber aestivum]